MRYGIKLKPKPVQVSASVHVVPHKGGWAIKKANSSAALRTFGTQKEAITSGREVAKSNHSALVIHTRDGRIRGKNSYGKDPSPPKG